MAEKPSSQVEGALKKIQDQLTCRICLDFFKEPKMLGCFHVFCTQCLQSLVDKGRIEQSLCCPNCRRQTDIPAGGVPALSGAFYINNLMEIQRMLKMLTSGLCSKYKKREAVSYCTMCGLVCQRCRETHYEWDDLSAHDIIDINTFTKDPSAMLQRRTPHCSKHHKKETDLFCATCEKLICRDCIVRLHYDHNYDLVSAVFPEHDKQITNSLGRVKEQIRVLEGAIQSVNSECDQTKDHEKATVTEIKSVFAKVRTTLEAREKELVNKAEEIAQRELKSLIDQRDKYQLQLDQLRNCTEYVEGSRKTCSKEEILKEKGHILGLVDCVMTNTIPEPLTVKEAANIQFSHSLPLLVNTCKQFGKVYYHSVHPGKCQISVQYDLVCMRGETAALPLKVFDCNGEPYMGQLDSLKCFLTHRLDRKVRKREHNVHNISYTPRYTGGHQLNILLEDIPISHSPVKVSVLPFLRAPDKVIDGLEKPWGVTVTACNEIIVAEWGNNCISFISSSNGDKRSIGVHGSGPGELYWPAGIAVVEDTLLIADYWNHRIQKWSLDGKHLSTVGSKGAGPLQFHQPVGIAVHPHSHKIYVADKGNSMIQVLNPNLTFSSSFRGKGSQCGEFKELCDVSIDSEGHLYVANCGNNWIQVFTHEGLYLREIGCEGDQLKQPVSIAIDNNNMILYIGEYGNNCVSVYSTTGKLVRTIGREEDDPIKFCGPFGLAVDNSGALYVSDTRNNCILIFK